MSQELQVPDSFKNRPMASAFATLPEEDSLDLGIGQSYPVLGYKGKVWSLRYRGEKHTIVRPDDGTPSAYLDVIILGQAPNKSKSFYKKFDPGTSEGDRPICASMDGVTPDLDVADKQCDSCALCPRNEWKTDATTGRKGRECTDYKRLAVLVLPTQTKAALGSPLMEPVFLRVPPDSLNSLASLGEWCKTSGNRYSSIVVRITFDPNKAHPCMVFRPLQGLTDAEAPVILALRQEPSVGRITGGTGITGPVRQVLAAPGSAATGIATLTISPDPTPPAAAPAAPALLLVSEPTPSTHVGRAATDLIGETQAALQTAADVGGEAGSTDAELDAEIAALITR